MISSMDKQKGFLLNPYRFSSGAPAAVKHKLITITGAIGAGTNYQVLLKIGESSGATGSDFNLGTATTSFPSDKNDLGDISFTAADGITALSSWVEQVTGTTPNRVAWIWVKVAADLGTNQDIYCYYNNGTAVQTSAGNNVFILFDDFNVSPIDAAKWVQNQGSGGLTIASSIATIASSNSFNNWLSVSTISDGTEVISRKYPANTSNATVGLTGFISFIRTDKDWDTSTRTEISWLDSSNNRTRTNLDASYTSAFYRIRIRRAGGVGAVLINDVVKATVSANLNTNVQAIWIGGSYDSGYSDQIDWVAVKKYQVTEPVFGSAGAEV